MTSAGLAFSGVDRSAAARGGKLLAVAVVLGCLALAVLTSSRPAVPAALVVSFAAAILVALRPKLGFFLLFGLVLLFEEGGADPLMLPGEYLLAGLSSTTGISTVIASPLELLIVLIFVSCGVRAVGQRRIQFRGGALFVPVALFAVALLMGTARGIALNGDLNIALWESRFIWYAIACYVLTCNLVRTRRDVRVLLGIALVATSLFAFEAAFRYLVLLRPGRIAVIPEFAYAHEDAIFLAALLLLILAQQVFGAPRWQRLIGLFTGPVALFALLAAQRRVGFIALILGFAVLALVLLVTHRRAFVLGGLPLILAGAVYFPLFESASGLIAQPARAIHSLYAPDRRDAASNRYRVLERMNVRATIDSEPLLGVGFGRPFLFVTPLPDLSWWPFWHYEPHNSVFWIWLKTGILGFSLFWFLMASTLVRAAHLTRVSKAPEARLLAVFALVTIIGVLTFAYVDLAFVSPRVTVVLGVVLGSIGVLGRIYGEAAE